jgi:Flp pilus assembly protein TadD
VASFRQAVNLKRDFAAAHNNLGNALRELGRLDEAVASLQEALRIQPNFPAAQNNLSMALQEIGKRDDVTRGRQ